MGEAKGTWSSSHCLLTLSIHGTPSAHVYCLISHDDLRSSCLHLRRSGTLYMSPGPAINMLWPQGSRQDLISVLIFLYCVFPSSSIALYHIIKSWNSISLFLLKSKAGDAERGQKNVLSKNVKTNQSLQHAVFTGQSYDVQILQHVNFNFPMNLWGSEFISSWLSISEKNKFIYLFLTFLRQGFVVSLWLSWN